MLDRRTRLHKQSVKARRDGLIILSLILGFVFIKWLYFVPPLLHPGGDVVIRFEKLNEIVKPVQAKGLSVDEIVDGIWMLESTRGKAKIGLQAYCESKGMWNELGYGGMAGVNGEKICFADKQAGFARVERWVIEHYKDYDNDLGMTLCYYNMGAPEGVYQTDCTYYQNYLKITK